MTEKKRKIAIVIHTGTETIEKQRQVLEALYAAKSAIAKGHELQIIFDGAGVRAAAHLVKPLSENQLYHIFREVRLYVKGACEACARHNDVKDWLEKNDIPMLPDEYRHPGFRNLRDAGYDILDF